MSEITTAEELDALAEVIFTGWTGYNYKPWHRPPDAARDEDWQSALAAASAVLRYRPDWGTS